MTASDSREAAPALDCDRAQVLLMGLIDGELNAAQEERVQDHLAVCVRCRSDEVAYRKLAAATGRATNAPRSSTDVVAGWERIHDRIARRAGWALLWIGLTVLIGYGAYGVLTELLLNPEEPLAVRLGLGTLAAGIILLGVNVIRERLYRHRTERYRGVQR